MRTRTLSALGALALLAACGGVPPAELARTTPYTVARTDGRFVSVAGLQMFAITEGEGRDVVLLHGNGASTYSWRKVIGPLATRYRVHAIDFPGYGFSDKPADAPYDAAWLSSMVTGYLDAAGVARAALVGNSMGGHVATETAILQPERVSALVLLGASGLSQPGDYSLATRALGLPVIGPVLRQLPARGRVRARLVDAVYDPTGITDADVDAYYQPLRTAGGANAYVARMRQTVPDGRPTRVATIGAPTLVVVGDTDRLVPRDVAERYHALIRGSELVVMEHTGHLPQEERPEQVVALITRWLDTASVNPSVR